MAISRSQRQYMGVRAILPPDLVYAKRNPTTTDVAFVKGTLWLNLASPGAFMYSGTSGVWIALGSGSSGGVVTINSNAAVAGNYVLAGTANQIAVGQTSGTTTFTIPSAFIAPGSIASTTTISVGTRLIVPTGANATMGTSAAMTAGAVTVATTSSSGTCKIFYARATTGGTTGDVAISAQSGTGFTLTSTSNSETSTFNWWIVNV